jgi:hypothetical protein
VDHLAQFLLGVIHLYQAGADRQQVALRVLVKLIQMVLVLATFLLQLQLQLQRRQQHQRHIVEHGYDPVYRQAMVIPTIHHCQATATAIPCRHGQHHQLLTIIHHHPRRYHQHRCHQCQAAPFQLLPHQLPPLPRHRVHHIHIPRHHPLHSPIPILPIVHVVLQSLPMPLIVQLLHHLPRRHHQQQPQVVVHLDFVVPLVVQQVHH